MDGIASVKLKKEDATNLHKGIVYQKTGKKNTLTGTVNRRSKVINAAKKLGDNRVLTYAENSFVYHVHPCYSNYVKRGDREVEEKTDDKEDCEPEVLGIDESVTFPQTRSHTGTKPSSAKKKVCIICDCKKKQGDTTLYRTESDTRAWKFLAATNFYKDAPYQRTVLCTDPKDIFVADVLYHGNCMNKYILKASHELEKISQCNTAADNAIDASEKETVSHVFEELCSKLDLDSRRYTLSKCCEKVNKSLVSSKNVECINNRQLKNLLIEKYREEKIGFTYPRKRNDAQMFYSVNIKSTEMAEQLQSNDFAEEFDNLPRQELLKFDFGLEASYCDGDDIKLSQAIYKMTSFPIWERFCFILLKGNISPA